MEIAGYRFIYKNMLYGNSSNVIVKDEWVFDYSNHFTITNDQGEVSNDYISHVLPIRKYGFLYKRVEYDENVPTFQVYTADGEEFVGVLYRFEGREVDHYFFCRGSVINLDHFFEAFIEEEGSYVEPIHVKFIKNWTIATHVIINGKEYDLLRHSYFATAETFDSFHFGECELKLVPFRKQ